jgi:hypothetical protein
MRKLLITLSLILLTLFNYGQTKDIIDTKKIISTLDTTEVIDVGINYKAPCTGGTNDDCSNAISLTVGGACVNGNTCDGTIEAGEPAPICDVTQTQTVWYSFVATDPSITVSTDISGSSCFATTAIYSGNCGSFTQISCADNALVLTNFLIALTVGDTYYIQVAYGDGGPCSNQAEFCISVDVTELGESCDSSTPFCTGTAETFTADVGSVAPSGNDYGCLLSQPNPTWFYLEVDVAGDIEMTMTNSNTVDIDFKVWGPFTDVTTACANLTAANDEDCSYSTSSVEIANITGAQVGEVYVMMITNFSNSSTDITFSQTGGSGETDCAILPIELVYFRGEAYEVFNLLEWVSASEINNDYYTIEKSIDGINWEYLSLIYGAGTSTEPLNYKFRDYYVKDTINYYRLSQTDFNGKTETFKIIAIDNSCEVREIRKTINLMGQEVDENYNGMVIELYDNNSVRKVFRD